MRHGRGCDCDDCFEITKVAELRAQGFSPCVGCGELTDSQTDHCGKCCPDCGGEGSYEAYEGQVYCDCPAGEDERLLGDSYFACYDAAGYERARARAARARRAA
jgi:hypothetical protein